VAEEALDGLEIVVGEEQMAGVRVTKCVRGNALGDAGTGDRGLDGTLNVGFVKVIAAHFAGQGRKVSLTAGKNHCQMYSRAAFLYFFSSWRGRKTPA